MLAPASLRMVHQRGYNNFNDVYINDYNEIQMALYANKNTDDIIWIYKRWGGDDHMTPEQIVYGFWFIAMNGLEKSPDFWNYLIPLVKKTISALDRETVKPILTAIEGASGMYL